MPGIVLTAFHLVTGSRQHWYLLWQRRRLEPRKGKGLVGNMSVVCGRARMEAQGTCIPEWVTPLMITPSCPMVRLCTLSHRIDLGRGRRVLWLSMKLMLSSDISNPLPYTMLSFFLTQSSVETSPQLWVWCVRLWLDTLPWTLPCTLVNNPCAGAKHTMVPQDACSDLFSWPCPVQRFGSQDSLSGRMIFFLNPYWVSLNVQ